MYGFRCLAVLLQHPLLTSFQYLANFPRIKLEIVKSASFATLGFPKMMVADNGPLFDFYEYECLFDLVHDPDLDALQTNELFSSQYD